MNVFDTKNLATSKFSKVSLETFKIKFLAFLVKLVKIYIFLTFEYSSASLRKTPKLTSIKYALKKRFFTKPKMVLPLGTREDPFLVSYKTFYGQT